MTTMMNEVNPPLDELEHWGVKGMRWGHRKDKDYPTYESTVDAKKLGSPIAKMDKTVHTSTQDAAHQVAGMLKQRYGYEVTEVRAIADKRSFKNYIAYVESGAADKNSQSKGVIHIQRRDLSPEMKDLEKSGWFGKDCGNVRAVMTHETAHSMFHAEEKIEGGIFRGKTVGGNIEARNKAFDAAVAAAKADGIKPKNFAKAISGYADAAFWREEAEAEMFSQYHWSSSPPKFIKTWGETLHKELGVDATPFREVVD